MAGLQNLRASPDGCKIAVNDRPIAILALCSAHAPRAVFLQLCHVAIRIGRHGRSTERSWNDPGTMNHAPERSERSFPLLFFLSTAERRRPFGRTYNM